MHGLLTCGSVENGSGAQKQQDTDEGVVQEADVEEHLRSRAGQLLYYNCMAKIHINPCIDLNWLAGQLPHNASQQSLLTRGELQTGAEKKGLSTQMW